MIAEVVTAKQGNRLNVKIEKIEAEIQTATEVHVLIIILSPSVHQEELQIADTTTVTPFFQTAQ